MELDESNKPLTMLQEQLTTAKKKQKKGKFKTMAIAGAIVPVAAFFVYQMSSGKSAPDDQWLKNTTTVKRGTIDLTISASGTVRPVHEVKISPKVTGLVKRLLVEQGAKVKKGQLLALMDDSNLIGQVDAARSAVNLAEATYDKAVNGNRPQEIAQAEAQAHKAEDGVSFARQALNRASALVKSRKEELIRDKTNAGRMTQLAKEGAVSDQERLNAVTLNNVTSISLEQANQELRQADSTLAQAKAEVETAKQQFSLLKAGSREEDIRAAQHEMQRAKGQLNFLQSQLNDTRIRAPFDGIVSQKYADEGAIVAPTTASATTSATSSSIVSLAGVLEVVAFVSETDMSHLKVGQKTQIIANAYPDRTFHGTIKLIAPAAVVTQNVTTFEVHSSIDDDKSEALMSGMNVNTEFHAGKLQNVLLVPTVCVITEKGKTGVLTAEKNGKPKFRSIKSGRTAGDKTQVLEGIEQGDKVFLALSEEQLKARGYTTEGGGFGGGGGGGGGRGMGLPRAGRHR